MTVGRPLVLSDPKRDEGLRRLITAAGGIKRLAALLGEERPTPNDGNGIYKWRTVPLNKVLEACAKLKLPVSDVRDDEYKPEVYGGQIPYEARPGVFVVLPKPEYRNAS